jgi:hypothetical protein
MAEKNVGELRCFMNNNRWSMSSSVSSNSLLRLEATKSASLNVLLANRLRKDGLLRIDDICRSLSEGSLGRFRRAATMALDWEKVARPSATGSSLSSVLRVYSSCSSSLTFLSGSDSMSCLRSLVSVLMADYILILHSGPFARTYLNTKLARKIQMEGGLCAHFGASIWTNYRLTVK